MNPLALIGTATFLVIVDKLLANKPESHLSIVRRAYARNLASQSQTKIVEGGQYYEGTARYLARRTKDDGTEHIHKGIDIAAPINAKIYSANDGEVFLISPDGKMRGYGNTVVIKHHDGTAALYAHQNKFADLVEGQEVSQGQHIGYVGKTESGSLNPNMKPHLHFEVHKNATKRINPDNPERIDPIKYLASVGMSV